MSEQLVFGLHAVSALLSNENRLIKQLYVSQDRKDSRMNELLTQAQTLGVHVIQLSTQKMNKQFSECNHQGIVALTEKLPEYTEKDIQSLLGECKSAAFILVLDGVTDPHNLGACLRSAEAAGVDFVVIPKDKSATITPVVSKVASGAAETMPLVRVTNLVRAIEQIKKEGVWVYGAAGESPNTLYALDLKGPVAMVMGAEGSGLRRLTREHCDDLYNLPMSGVVSSLNVSVAAGISLFETVRQRSI
jgi:23S rRNA (guanosine2251-2'-O)-methyltransferase